MRNGLCGLPVAALVTALLAGPIGALAQNEGSSMPGGAPSGRAAVQLTDETFAVKVAQGNLAQTQYSRLALERSQDQRVRKFAEQMLTAHDRAGKELKEIATGKGIALPDGLTPQQQASLAALSKQQGPAFDTAYAKQMQQDQDRAVALFERAADSEQLDAALRAFARKALPRLKNYQKQVRELNTATASTASREPARRIYHVW